MLPLASPSLPTTGAPWRPSPTCAPTRASTGTPARWRDRTAPDCRRGAPPRRAPSLRPAAAAARPADRQFRMLWPPRGGGARLPRPSRLNRRFLFAGPGACAPPPPPRPPAPAAPPPRSALASPRKSACRAPCAPPPFLQTAAAAATRGAAAGAAPRALRPRCLFPRSDLSLAARPRAARLAQTHALLFPARARHTTTQPWQAPRPPTQRGPGRGSPAALSAAGRPRPPGAPASARAPARSMGPHPTRPAKEMTAARERDPTAPGRQPPAGRQRACWPRAPGC
jgi:hypothetical protein